MKEAEDRFAATVTVGTKGQIVIPIEMRNMFDIKPGDRLIVLADRSRGMAIPPKDAFAGLSQLVFGGGEKDE